MVDPSVSCATDTDDMNTAAVTFSGGAFGSPRRASFTYPLAARYDVMASRVALMLKAIQVPHRVLDVAPCDRRHLLFKLLANTTERRVALEPGRSIPAARAFKP